MEGVFEDDGYIRLYGKLIDKFGDNGVVSVVIGRKNGTALDIDLWLMSCRVCHTVLPSSCSSVFVKPKRPKRSLTILFFAVG